MSTWLTHTRPLPSLSSQGAVTISTNMAGRGTDILLGGNPDYMARLKLREMLMPEIVSQGESDL